LSIPFKELDSDGDTVSDLDEETHGTDPSNRSDAFADPDDDGLPTWREIDLGLDPFNPDTDGGGAKDGAEIAGATDPADPHDDDQTGIDSDGDGMTDACELRWGFDKNDPGDGPKDKDNDGLTNAEECQLGTSPEDQDSDNDGKTDSEEVENDTDPRDPLDRGIPVDKPDVPDCDAQCPAPADHGHFLFWCIILFLLIIILLILTVFKKK
jgi:hypothetical protein